MGLQTICPVDEDMAVQSLVDVWLTVGFGQ